ncbi:uncharacterized protein LOC122197164 [Lactuca sativa]|uniref:uncharacterized protein LOC122197164 n=1 Tax=Lactuca sativa TaxID=4236 RepID=UPI001C6923A1|nr:uncharacterized protein LOC122197164 [Lactuca sativa]
MGTLLGTCINNFYVKKQTCFQCGTIGHITRNFPHHLYVSYYQHGWQNLPRGRFSKRNPSRSHSRNGDWNTKKAKNQTSQDEKGMSDKKPNSRDGSIKQRSSRRPVSSSKPCDKASIRSNKKWIKPNYRWAPKVHTTKSSNDSNTSSSSVSDKQDMSWDRVPWVDDNGELSFIMDWVPKAN